MKLEFSYKHLPGEHDQQSHTPKIYGTGRTAGSVPKDLNPALTQDPYSGTERQIGERRAAKRDFRGQVVASEPFKHLLEGSNSERDLQDYTIRNDVKDALVTKLSQESGVGYETVNMIIKQWTHTSNDEDYRSLSLQEAVNQELGVELSDWQKGKFQDIKTKMNKLKTEYETKVKKSYNYLLAKRKSLLEGTLEDNYEDPQGPEGPYATSMRQMMEASDERLMEWAKENVGFPDAEAYANATGTYEFPIMSRPDERKLMRSMYDGTQERLKADGWDMDGNITLYRGTGGLEQDYDPGTVVNYKGNAMESWSATPWVARKFGTHMLAMSVPVRNILSTARTGFGSLPEAEYVIFGSIPGTQAVVVSW